MLAYFELYGMSPTFHPDAGELRQAYLKIQKEWHPDFFIADAAKYAEALQKTSLNNEAYKALQRIETIVEYVLKEYDQLQEGEKNVLPTEFLLEMLELNDTIGQAVLGDAWAREEAEEELSDREAINMADIHRITKGIEENNAWSAGSMEELKSKFQEFRYLRRLRSNLQGKREI